MTFPGTRFAYPVSSNPYFSRIRLVESLYQFHDRRFSGTVITDHRRRLSSRNANGKVMKDFFFAPISKVHVFEHNISVLGFCPGIAFFRMLLFHIKNIPDMDKRAFRAHHVLPHRQKLRHIEIHLRHIGAEHINPCRFHFPGVNQSGTAHCHYDSRKKGVEGIGQNLNLLHESIVYICLIP